MIGTLVCDLLKLSTFESEGKRKSVAIQLKGQKGRTEKYDSMRNQDNLKQQEDMNCKTK